MRFRLLLVGASLALAASVHAQAPAPAKRFPWDQRPNRCFLPPADGIAERAECKTDDWPNFGETRRRIDRLLGEPDFDLLERAELEVGFSRERFKTGEYLFEAWFLSLDSFFKAWGPRGKSLAADWAKAKGNGGYAPLGLAMAAHAEAWSGRGTGYAHTVSPEALEIYGKKLDEADKLLETARSGLRQMPTWHMVKLRLAFERRQTQRAPIAVLKQGTELWPEFLPLYTASMYYLTPKWGGTFEQMDAIARYAMERTREGVKAARYAQVYERHLRVNPDSTYTLRDTQVDWELMKQGFRELEDKTPWMMAAYAVLACQMRDREEARRLYKLYDERNPGARVDPLDSCRAFAMSSQPQ
jgi:hypothetical protein